MRYQVNVEVATPDYKYTQRLDDCGIWSYPSREAAQEAIENYMARAFPNWPEGRKASFRSHCSIKEIAEPRFIDRDLVTRIKDVNARIAESRLRVDRFTLAPSRKG
jgi:hypothetical protein